LAQVFALPALLPQHQHQHYNHRPRLKMSNLLEFPPSTLPSNIRDPPYVIFGINGEVVCYKLPRRIPLNAVLHFMPKLAQYVLPEPQNLPKEIALGVLDAPHVGIDIYLDITSSSFHRIILTVLQSAGIFVPKERFEVTCTRIALVAVHRAWLLLELPSAGLDGLIIQLKADLMMGTAIRLNEIKMFWNNFPANSDMLHIMAINYVQSHIAHQYAPKEFSAIRHWSLATQERWNVFKAAEELHPEFGKKLSADSSSEGSVNSEITEEKLKAMEKAQLEEADEEAAQEVLNKKAKAEGKKPASQGSKKTKSKGSKKTASKGPKKTSMEGAAPKATMAKSMESKDQSGATDDMATKLADALQQVQLKRESESAEEDEEAKETLQPTVYDGSENPK
jgi:hypothetical protein